MIYTEVDITPYTNPVYQGGMTDRHHILKGLGAALKHARKSRKVSRDALAEKIDTTGITLYRVETGRVKISDTWVDAYAKGLGMQPEDIYALASQKLVPIVGEVGAGAEVYPIDDSPIIRNATHAGDQTNNYEIPETHPLEYVDPPPGSTGKGLLALKLKGDSWEPYLNEGEIVFYSERVTDPTICIGKKCVVKIKNGPTLFKVIKRGSEYGRYRLLSPNASEIENVEIEWCARVSDIRSM